MKRCSVIACVLTLATSSVAFAVEAGKEGYAPGLGEFMAMQQMRHAKLWFAGKNRNWDLADYELDELREGFDDVVRLHPSYEKIPVADLVGTVMKTPLVDLAKAIEAKNSARFSRAFDGLTAACNACHRAAHHAFIVIRRPAKSTFSNQEFAVRKK
jgi:hypothetical protein